MQEGEAAFIDEAQRVLKHRIGFGRETGNEVGPEDQIGPQGAHLVGEANGIVAAVAALHALQDHVVAGLQRQMEMRHQPFLGHDEAVKLVIDLDHDRARRDAGAAVPAPK